MSASIRILSWKAEGLRCPDHHLEFSRTNAGSPHSLTLIQMPNGTGKTTTLALLKAALANEAASWTTEKISSFRPSEESSGTGFFEVKLTANGQLVTITLVFDFGANTVTYRTAHGSGVHAGYNPPRPIRNLLHKDFVNLYIFDGELARKMLDERETKAEGAIDTLFNISSLNHISQKFDQYWEKHRGSASDQKGFTQRMKKAQDLSARHKELTTEQEKLSESIAELEKREKGLSKTQEALLKKNKDYGPQYEKALGDLHEAKRNVETNLLESLARFRNPVGLLPSFATQLGSFKNSLDTLKLPSSTSMEFFHELSEQDDCVCGRPLDDDAREAILKRSQLYMGDDEVTVINGIKQDIRNFCKKDETEESNKKIQEQLSKGKELWEAFEEANERVEQLKLAEQEHGSEELKRVTEELKGVETDLKRKQDRLEELEAAYDPTGDDNSSSIATINRLLREQIKKVEEVTKARHLRAKVEKITAILNRASEAARTKVKTTLVKETNQCIEKLLPRNPVMVRGINKCVQIGQGGASEGQTLAIGYAFLKSLFSHDNHKVPFIMDSPAIPLDLGNRPEAARIIPELAEQAILFVISSERAKFVPVLKEHAKNGTQFITLFKKSGKTEKLRLAATKVGGKETDSGVVVEDENYFNAFDQDEEK